MENQSPNNDCPQFAVAVHEDPLKTRPRYRNRNARKKPRAQKVGNCLPATKKENSVAENEGMIKITCDDCISEGAPLKDSRGVLMNATSTSKSKVIYLRSEGIQIDYELAFVAVAQSSGAWKYIGDELKRDRRFVTEALRELVALNHEQACCPSVIDVRDEPARSKASKYAFTFPRSWRGSACNEAELGDGTLQLPFGTDVGEATERTEMEIITAEPYAGQNKVVEHVDETLLHDLEVLHLLFELDPVALLFEDLRRKDALSIASDASRSSRPMKPRCKKVVDKWHNNYEARTCQVKRIQSWPTSFWRPEDVGQIAIGDNIHFWIECVRRTRNPSFLAEAPKDLLTHEDNLLEAVKVDIKLFQCTPWKLRVSETFYAKLRAAFPGRFVWITLEDPRAEIPSKARDSEMKEMIEAFSAVQARIGLQQQHVPFIQCSDLPRSP